MYMLIILLPLLHITTCTIYNVTPDDTTCHRCHNLQHYLLNATKYFISNTQLLFLPGLHQLHTNLIIQNVHNISLIGSTTNGTTPDTVIQCDSSVGIIMNNITLLMMKNMVIKNCTTGYDLLTESHIAMLITSCSFIELYHIEIRHTNISSLKGIDIFGDSILAYITCDAVYLYLCEHKPSRVRHNQSMVLIDHFHGTTQKKNLVIIFKSLSLYSDHHLIIKLINTKMVVSDVENIYFAVLTQFQGFQISIHVNNCIFHFPNDIRNIITIIGVSHIEINHCNFYSNGVAVAQRLIDIRNCKGLIAIKNSNFNQLKCHELMNIQVLDKHKNAMVVIQNTTFSNNKLMLRSLICIKNALVSLIGSVKFYKNKQSTKIWQRTNIRQTLIELHNSKIIAEGYIEFTNNYAESIINHNCIKDLDCFFFSIHGSAVINITSNTLTSYFIAEYTQPLGQKIHYPVCYFQYFDVGDYGCHIIEKNTSITLHNNKYKKFNIKHYFLITNCTSLIATGYLIQHLMALFLLMSINNM